MSDQTTVYDLGSLTSELAPDPVRKPVPTDRTAPLRTAKPAGRVMPRPAPASFDLYGTLSLFFPGVGHVLRGEASIGLFFIASVGFAGALGWALVETLDRVTATSRILGFPGGPGLWALCGVFVAGASLHIASVATSGSRGHSRALPPAIPGVASAIVPGWGQVLNGSYRRACLFVGALWAIAAAWILAIPELQAYLESLRLYIPTNLMVVTSPMVRYTAPAVVWTLSIYDAATTAAARR